MASIFYGLVAFMILLLNFISSSLIEESNSILDSFGYELYDQDMFRRCDQLISSRGFNNEDHFVITEDGYKLHVHRIINPFARLFLGLAERKPVLMVHGVFNSCAAFLYNSPGGKIIQWPNKRPPKTTDDSYAFLLANSGYDVWILNVRGTSYSRNHTTLDPDKDAEYWNFSFAEMARYDVPNTIDYILNLTGHDRLVYIGFSQGTALMFILLSKQPEYNEKLDTFIAMAPILYLKEMQANLTIHLASEFQLYKAIKLLNGETQLDEIGRFFSYMCPLSIFFQEICLNMAAYGEQSRYINASRVSVYLYHSDKTSEKNLEHAYQSYKLDEVREFNYGKEGNLKKYGKSYPPKYNLTKIPGEKIVLVSSVGDIFSTPESIARLKKTIGNKFMHHHIIKDPEWSHFDFMLSKTAYKRVGRYLLTWINESLNSV